MSDKNLVNAGSAKSRNLDREFVGGGGGDFRERGDAGECVGARRRRGLW